MRDQYRHAASYFQWSPDTVDNITLHQWAELVSDPDVDVDETTLTELSDAQALALGFKPLRS